MERTLARSGRVASLLMVVAGCGHRAAEMETVITADAAVTGDATLPAATCDGPCKVSFASGPDWSVYDDDPATNPAVHKLGAAQPVCLTPTAPPNCPAGAVIYGLAGGGWSFSLLTVPGLSGSGARASLRLIQPT